MNEAWVALMSAADRLENVASRLAQLWDGQDPYLGQGESLLYAEWLREAAQLHRRAAQLLR